MAGVSLEAWCQEMGLLAQHVAMLEFMISPHRGMNLLPEVLDTEVRRMLRCARARVAFLSEARRELDGGESPLVMRRFG